MIKEFIYVQSFIQNIIRLPNMIVWQAISRNIHFIVTLGPTRTLSWYILRVCYKLRLELNLWISLTKDILMSVKFSHGHIGVLLKHDASPCSGSPLPDLTTHPLPITSIYLTPYPSPPSILPLTHDLPPSYPLPMTSIRLTRYPSPPSIFIFLTSNTWPSSS